MGSPLRYQATGVLSLSKNYILLVYISWDHNIKILSDFFGFAFLTRWLALFSYCKDVGYIFYCDCSVLTWTTNLLCLDTQERNFPQYTLLKWGCILYIRRDMCIVRIVLYNPFSVLCDKPRTKGTSQGHILRYQCAYRNTSIKVPFYYYYYTTLILTNELQPLWVRYLFNKVHKLPTFRKL